MSAPGTVIYGLTKTVSLVVTCADVETGLTHARRVALQLGFGQPVALTTVITEQATDTRSEVWSDISHQEAVKWVQREAHRKTLVGVTLRNR